MTPRHAPSPHPEFVAGCMCGALNVIEQLMRVGNGMEPVYQMVVLALARGAYRTLLTEFGEKWADYAAQHSEFAALFTEIKR